MPYSMDPEANKRNPDTPSPLVSLHEQLIYKIAALDASVQGGFRRLDEKIDRIQSDLHAQQLDTNDRINKLQQDMNAGFLRKRNRLDVLERDHVAVTEFDALCNRVNEMKLWQEKMMGRWAGAVAVVLLVWTVFGDAIKAIIGTSI